MASIIRGTVAQGPVWATRSAGKAEQRFAKITGSAGKFDVAVVGGGVFGVTAAMLLKEAGRKVALIEALTFGQSTGAHSTAKMSSQQNTIFSQLTKMHGAETARKYGAMNEGALNQFESLVNKYGIDCDLRRMPNYTWTSEEKQVDTIKKEYEDSIAAGMPAEFIQGSPSDLPASVEAKCAVRFQNQIAFNPYDYCRLMAQKVEGNGCSVFENSRIVACSEDKIHELKTTDDGSISADKVILATHLPIMDRSGHFAFLPGSRSHCISVKLSRPVLREMCMSADMPMRSLRVVDREGLMIVVAGESIEIGNDTDTDKYYARLEEWARKHFPVESVESKWSAMDYMSSDHLPWIGPLYRGTDTIFTATGFSKWGLSNGVAAAQIIRDQIQGVENPYSSMVDSCRWTLKIAPKFIQENIHTCKHFVTDYVKSLVAPSISTLKPGQGGLVSVKGHTLAVGAFLDESNQMHVVKPICTHLGCHLIWNQGDKVWDCPCHGSQFDVDGVVRHGPACVNLEKLKDLEW